MTEQNSQSPIDKGVDNLDVTNPEFVNALNLVEHSNTSLFLTGKAGTGKSTFLRYVTAHTKKSHVILAPTGIAAVNVGGQTLHSFFKIPFKPLLPDDPEFSDKEIKKRLKYSREFVKILRNLDLIIIDEISMVRADIIDFIDRVLRFYCHNKREPFAGKQLLLVGDIFQLEPVITADMRQVLNRHYRNLFFFDADAFKDTKLVSIELRKVYRQDEPEFVAMLDRIRSGVLTPDDQNAINARVSPADAAEKPSAEKMTMTLATRRDVVEDINSRKLAAIKKRVVSFPGLVKGDFPETSLPAPLQLQLKEGAQVVFVKNDRDRRWVNGTVGRIVECTKTTVKVQLEDGSVHNVEPERWANVVYKFDEEKKAVKEEEIGTFTQFPLKLAWALTIHKSQGLTFSNLIIDMTGGAFTSGQTYVAMSRCRSLGGITLKSPLGRRDVFVNPAVLGFSKGFNDQLAMEEALRKAQRRARLAESATLWREGKRGDAISAFMSVAREEPALLHDARIERLIRCKCAALTDTSKAKAEMLAEKLAQKEAQLQALADEYCELGNYCLEGEQLLPALGNFDKALRLDPDNITAMTLRGKTLTAMGEYHDAMDQLLRARDMIAPRDAKNSRHLDEIAKQHLASIDAAIKAIEKKL